MAIASKAVRGAQDQHLTSAYLLSAFASRRGAVLTQLAIGERENELTQALPLLRQIDLNEVAVTGDALLAQRALCTHIVEQGGQYVFEVKDNQPALLQAQQRSFRQGPGRGGARTIDGGHGRIDVRTLHARSGSDYESLTWPGLAQVCRLVHQTQRQGRWQTEAHYKITSLPPERAGPADLFRFSRLHWAIENQLHYLRDVPIGEDGSRIRRGAAPQAMAALRNLVVANLHRDGVSSRAAGLRRFTWHPDQAAHALGLTCPPRVADSRVA